MRIQHNISPPLPGRGGNRKRKRDEPDSNANPGEPGPSINTFKVEHTIDEEFMSTYDGGLTRFSGLPIPPVPHPDFDTNEPPDMESIPRHLLEVMDHSTGLIMGRSPSMVKYLLMKAKHKWVLEQHETLIEELRVLRHEEKCWKERTDALLDEVLRATLGLVHSSHCELPIDA